MRKKKIETYEEFRAWMNVLPQTPNELKEKIQKVESLIKQHPEWEPFIIMEMKKKLEIYKKRLGSKR